MNTKRVLSGALGTVMTAGTLVMAAPGVASAQPANGHEHFTVIFTSENAPGRITATGTFGATGKTIDLTPNATGSMGLQKAIFPGVGTFLIHTNSTPGTDSFNHNTCVEHFTATDTFTISGGTGQFKGISGTGTDTVSGTFVGRRTQTGCNENMTRGFVIVQANANLSFTNNSSGG